jgi:hypothetical protein
VLLFYWLHRKPIQLQLIQLPLQHPNTNALMVLMDAKHAQMQVLVHHAELDGI